MSTPTLDTIAGRRAAVDLAAVREMWGDLLAAIDEAPRGEWPPRDSRALGVVTVVDSPDGPTIGRIPLTLREHPAPLNLNALSAAVEVERALFTAADHIAHQVQRPVSTGRDAHGRYIRDPDDLLDPARWHPATSAGPGSRHHGVHWCAVWLEGRALGEQAGDLFGPMSAGALDELADIAARARRIVEQALARAGRRTALDTPCPWCSGPLTAHTTGEASTAVVVCGTGSACPAPVPLSGGARAWQGPALVPLYTALAAAPEKQGESGA